jgi:hypothetical protein
MKKRGNMFSGQPHRVSGRITLTWRDCVYLDPLIPGAMMAPVIAWLYAIARLNGFETRRKWEIGLGFPEAPVSRFVLIAVCATILGIALYVWRTRVLARLVGCYGNVVETNGDTFTVTYRLDGRTHTSTKGRMNRQSSALSSVVVVLDPREPLRIRHLWSREETAADRL